MSLTKGFLNTEAGQEKVSGLKKTTDRRAGFGQTTAYFQDRSPFFFFLYNISNTLTE